MRVVEAPPPMFEAIAGVFPDARKPGVIFTWGDTTVRVVEAPPPMFEAIAGVFPDARKPGVIFTWGDTIYNPSRARISPELAEHEEVHHTRQGADPEGWWKRYLSEASFRYAEELPAHGAEYRAFCRRHPEPGKRHKYLFAIAARLAGPLYGSVATHRDAMQAILKTGRRCG